MDGEDLENVVHIDQADMDRFQQKAQIAILELTTSEEKFDFVTKLIGIHGMLLETAWECGGVDHYREFLERVMEAHEPMMKNVLAGCEAAERDATIENPMRFWSPHNPDYVPYKDRS